MNDAVQHTTTAAAQPGERSVLWTIAETADLVVLGLVVVVVIALLVTRRQQVTSNPDGVRRRGWLHRTFISGWFGMGPDTGRRVTLTDRETTKRPEQP